jgi:ABC-2 type transport system permease protein
MSSSLRPYLKFFETRFQSLVQYRAAAWAGFVCQFFWGLIMIMVMQAFYRSSRAPQAPMSLAGVISYIWLGQAFLGMLPWNVDRDMMMMVEDGSLCYELLKPLDLHTYWVYAVSQSTLYHGLFKSSSPIDFLCPDSASYRP